MTDSIIYDKLSGSIETNHLGFSALMGYYSYASKFQYKSIQLNLYNVTYLEANMSSILLSIIYRLKQENKVNTYIEIPEHLNVLYRNGFYNHLLNKSNEKADDSRESTIPLRTFETTADTEFARYLKNEFFAHRGLNNLAKDLKTNLISNFEEIFINAFLHSEAKEPIFTCGQYFPERKVLKFTFVDIGVGFLKKIKLKTNGLIDTDSKAIDWATLGNTTKDLKWGVGGTGLKELRNYCMTNNGSLHIISGFSYWQITNNKVFTYNLISPFRGAIVNLIFRNI